MHTAWSPAEGLNNSSDLGTLGGLPGPGDRAVSTQNGIIRVNAPSGSGPARSSAASPIRGHKIDGIGTLDIMEMLGLAHLCANRSGEEAFGHIACISQSEGSVRGKDRPPGEGRADVHEVGPVSIFRPASRTSGGATPFVMGKVGGVDRMRTQDIGKGLGSGVRGPLEWEGVFVPPVLHTLEI